MLAALALAASIVTPSPQTYHDFHVAYPPFNPIPPSNIVSGDQIALWLTAADADGWELVCVDHGSYYFRRRSGDKFSSFFDYELNHRRCHLWQADDTCRKGVGR